MTIFVIIIIDIQVLYLQNIDMIDNFGVIIHFIGYG